MSISLPLLRTVAAQADAENLVGLRTGGTNLGTVVTNDAKCGASALGFDAPCVGLASFEADLLRVEAVVWKLKDCKKEGRAKILLEEDGSFAVAGWQKDELAEMGGRGV